MLNRVGDWGMLLLLIALVFVLVRPNSQGPKLVDTGGKALVNLLNAATGGGGWSAR